MRICTAHIHNYRSIKDLELRCRPMLVLLGENNAGKSNIMAAIEFALTSSAKPEPEDLFAFRDADDETIWVELTFSDLTDQEKTTFHKYLRADGTVCIRKTAKWDGSGGPTISYNGYTQVPLDECLRSENVSQYTDRERAGLTPFYSYLPATGRLTKAQVEEAQRKYIDENTQSVTFEEKLEAGPLLGAKNVASGVLPDFFFVPAVRDLDDEAKVKSTTIFGRLLSRAIEDMAANEPRFTELRDNLNVLVRSLNRSVDGAHRPQQLAELEATIQQELSSWGVTVSIEITPPDINRLFELGTDIRLDDGHDSIAQRKGHGLQRAVLLGFVKAWAQVLRKSTADTSTSARRASESMIFAIEEPELFLHPQAQRSLAEALQQLASSDNRQILLCSHSAHFVDLDCHQQIAVAKKLSPQMGTIICQCTEELFEGTGTDDRKHRFHMAYWLNPDRGEMFFAKKVVFVEGETEKSILPYLAKKLNCYCPDVSIVDCGSKHNLPLYITIAKAFSLNYHVLHDEDPLPDPIPANGNSSRIDGQRRTFALNRQIAELVGDPSRISVSRPDFETSCAISKSQGDKIGKALAALEHFQALSTANIPTSVQDLVAQVYRVSIHED